MANIMELNTLTKLETARFMPNPLPMENLSAPQYKLLLKSSFPNVRLRVAALSFMSRNSLFLVPPHSLAAYAFHLTYNFDIHNTNPTELLLQLVHLDDYAPIRSITDCLDDSSPPESTAEQQQQRERQRKPTTVASPATATAVPPHSEARTPPLPIRSNATPQRSLSPAPNHVATTSALFHAPLSASPLRQRVEPTPEAPSETTSGPASGTAASSRRSISTPPTKSVRKGGTGEALSSGSTKHQATPDTHHRVTGGSVFSPIPPPMEVLEALNAHPSPSTFHLLRELFDSDIMQTGVRFAKDAPGSAFLPQKQSTEESVSSAGGEQMGSQGESADDSKKKDKASEAISESSNLLSKDVEIIKREIDFMFPSPSKSNKQVITAANTRPNENRDEQTVSNNVPVTNIPAKLSASGRDSSQPSSQLDYDQDALKNSSTKTSFSEPQPHDVANTPEKSASNAPLQTPTPFTATQSTVPVTLTPHTPIVPNPNPSAAYAYSPTPYTDSHAFHILPYDSKRMASNLSPDSRLRALEEMHSTNETKLRTLNEQCMYYYQLYEAQSRALALYEQSWSDAVAYYVEIEGAMTQGKEDEKRRSLTKRGSHSSGKLAKLPISGIEAPNGEQELKKEAHRASADSNDDDDVASQSDVASENTSSDDSSNNSDDSSSDASSDVSVEASIRQLFSQYSLPGGLPVHGDLSVKSRAYYATISALRERMVQSEVVVQQLQQQLQFLQQQGSDVDLPNNLKGSIAPIYSNVTYLNEKNALLHEKVESLEGRLRSVDGEYQRSQDGLRLTQAKLDALQREHSELRTEVTLLRCAKEETQAVLETMKENHGLELHKKSIENQQLTKRLNTLEQAHKSEMDMLKEVQEDQIRELQENLMKLQEQSLTLRHTLQEKNKEIDELKLAARAQYQQSTTLEKMQYDALQMQSNSSAAYRVLHKTVTEHLAKGMQDIAKKSVILDQLVKDAMTQFSTRIRLAMSSIVSLQQVQKLHASCFDDVERAFEKERETWGTALLEQAKRREDEALLVCTIEKLRCELALAEHGILPGMLESSVSKDTITNYKSSKISDGVTAPSDLTSSSPNTALSFSSANSAPVSALYTSHSPQVSFHTTRLQTQLKRAEEQLASMGARHEAQIDAGSAALVTVTERVDKALQLLRETFENHVQQHVKQHTSKLKVVMQKYPIPVGISNRLPSNQHAQRSQHAMETTSGLIYGSTALTEYQRSPLASLDLSLLDANSLRYHVKSLLKEKELLHNLVEEIQYRYSTIDSSQQSVEKAHVIALRNELNAKDNELHSLTFEVKKLEEMLMRQRELLDRANAEASSVKSELMKTTSARIDELEHTNTKLQSSLHAAEDALDSKQKEIARLRNELHQLHERHVGEQKHTLDSFTKQLTMITTEAERLRNEKESLLVQLQVKSSSDLDTMETLKRLQNELVLLKRDRNTLLSAFSSGTVPSSTLDLSQDRIHSAITNATKFVGVDTPPTSYSGSSINTSKSDFASQVESSLSKSLERNNIPLHTSSASNSVSDLSAMEEQPRAASLESHNNRSRTVESGTVFLGTRSKSTSILNKPAFNAQKALDLANFNDMLSSLALSGNSSAGGNSLLEQGTSNTPGDSITINAAQLMELIKNAQATTAAYGPNATNTTPPSNVTTSPIKPSISHSDEVKLSPNNSTSQGTAEAKQRTGSPRPSPLLFTY